MKFIELRLNIDDREIDNTENTYEKKFTPNMVLIDAAKNPTQVAYYSSILEIGPCTRTTLTNRAKNLAQRGYNTGHFVWLSLLVGLLFIILLSSPFFSFGMAYYL